MNPLEPGRIGTEPPEALSSKAWEAFEAWDRTVRTQMTAARDPQRAALEEAACWVASVLVDGRSLFTFGTGHSHLLALEPFYRAGGLAAVVPILDEPLMLHRSASASTQWERREGLAESLLERYRLGSGDLLWIFSNSGRNGVPIELALGARRRGARVVALVNREHGKAHPSRHASGKGLADVADLVLDNAGVAGDAALIIPGLPTAVGPTSTVLGAYLVQGVLVMAMRLAVDQGWEPEVYRSSNADGDDWNARLLARHRGRNPHL